MKIETVPLDSLREDSKNARAHPEANMEAIRGSLLRFGQRLPLVVRDRVVVAGNGRLRAMRDLGWEECSVVVADDLTPDEARLFALADNRTAELADWDYEVLTSLVSDLDMEALASIGWSADYTENLLAADWSPPPVEDGALDEHTREPKEGAPIRLTIEQRELFDQVATQIREQRGDIRDGEVVRLLCVKEWRR